jgi:hypothetical protein
MGVLSGSKTPPELSVGMAHGEGLGTMLAAVAARSSFSSDTSKPEKRAETSEAGRLRNADVVQALMYKSMLAHVLVRSFRF